MTPDQLAPFSSDMPECELSAVCQCRESKSDRDLVTSPSHTHTAHPWRLLGVMGLSAEHGLNASYETYSHTEVEEMFGKGKLCAEALHRCVASAACCPGTSLPSLHSERQTLSVWGLESPIPGIWSQPQTSNLEYLPLFCGHATQPNFTWYIFFFFFAIKACDVLEKVQCFPKIHCPVTAALATSENLSPGFVECLVMIKVALILWPNFAFFYDTGQISTQWSIHSALVGCCPLGSQSRTQLSNWTTIQKANI